MKSTESAFKCQWHDSTHNGGKRMACRDTGHGVIFTHAPRNLAVATLDVSFLRCSPGEESDNGKDSYDSVRDPRRPLQASTYEFMQSFITQLQETHGTCKFITAYF